MGSIEDIALDHDNSEIQKLETITKISLHDLHYSAASRAEKISNDFIRLDQYSHTEGQYIAPLDLLIVPSDNESVASDGTESEEIPVYYVLLELKEKGFLPYDITLEDFSKFLEEFNIKHALINGMDSILEAIEWLDIGGCNTVIGLCRWRLDNRIILNKIQHIRAALNSNGLLPNIHVSRRAILTWLQQLGLEPMLRESEGIFGLMHVVATVLKSSLGWDVLSQRLEDCQRNEKIKKGANCAMQVKGDHWALKN